MITIKKLEEYEEYHGYYDGFYMQRVRNGTNITNDDEWYLISNLIQDMRLVNKGITSKKFSDNLHNSLKENCNNQETISKLEQLANEKW